MTDNALLDGKVSRRTVAKRVATAPVALGVARGYDLSAAMRRARFLLYGESAR